MIAALLRRLLPVRLLRLPCIGAVVRQSPTAGTSYGQRDMCRSARMAHGGHMRRIILPACWLSTAAEQRDAVAEPHEQRQLKLRLPLGQLSGPLRLAFR
jgi:hypothetical protein